MNRRHRATRQQGWGLLETLLTLGAISVLSAAVFVALRPATATAQAKAEQDNLRDLAAGIEQSFGLLGTFAGVSTEAVSGEAWVPARMRQGGDLRTEWGTAVGFYPYTVAAPGDAFLVSYPLAPAEVCARLAAAAALHAFDIQVEGRSVYTAGQVDPAKVAEQCGQHDAASMGFVYHSGLVAGQAAGAAPLDLQNGSPGVAPPPAPAGVVVVGSAPPVAPAGSVAPVGVPPAVVGTAPGPGLTPPASPFPVSPPATPPAPTLPPPAPAPSACVPPPTETQTREAACGAGAYGWQDQARSRFGYCALAGQPYGPYEAWEPPRYSSWSTWATTANHCATCPAPATERDTRWAVPYTLANCPAGQYGTTEREREQERTRVKSYDCPAGTTSLPPADFTAWTTWSNTGATRQTANHCATCPAPSTDTQDDWQARSGACPLGQVGERTWEELRQRSRTASWDCPAGTATLPPPAYAYGAWSWTGTRRNEVDTCAPMNLPKYWGTPWGYVADWRGGTCTWSTIVVFELRVEAGKVTGYRPVNSPSEEWLPMPAQSVCPVSWTGL